MAYAGVDVLDVVLIAVNAPHPANVLAAATFAVTPLGVAYLGAVLEQAGFRVALIDMNAPPCPGDWVVEYVAANRPRLIGLSCTTESFGNAVRLGRRLRHACPGAVIAIGGPHVTFQVDEALATGAFDVIVLREGEQTVVELASVVCGRAVGATGAAAAAGVGARHLESIAGIAYPEPRAPVAGRAVRTRSRPLMPDIDRLPMPARHLFVPPLQRGMAPVLTGRGCPGACAFCSATAMAGGRRRVRSVENVAAELCDLRRRGLRAVFFVDDTMTAEPALLEGLLDAIERERLDLTWVCESRVDGVSLPLLERMADLGCQSVQFGVESGSQESLDAMGKGTTVGQIEQAVGWAAAAGISPVCSFIIGQPWDTPQSVAASLEFAAGLQRRHLARCAFALLVPFPGTRLWRQGSAHGLRRRITDFDAYNMHTPICTTRYFSLAQLRDLHFEAVCRMAAATGEELALMFPFGQPAATAGAAASPAGSPLFDWY